MTPIPAPSAEGAPIAARHGTTEKVLSPRDIVVKFRHYVSSEGKDILAGKPQEEQPDLPDTEWITPEELWACTTCNACVEECPLFIDQMGKIMDMRRFLTLEGRLSGTATRTLQKLQNNGNPWGFPEADRGAWLSEMDVPILGVSAENASEFDVIYWTGCFGGYDPRGQKVSKAIVTLLKIAGVNFAVMGPAETCTGDPARRLGEEALYQMLAVQNIETMNELKVKKILANCPHCFNTIKNEYPEFGGHYEVVHHTDFLFQLIQEGKLNPDAPIEEKINLPRFLLPRPLQQRLRLPQRDTEKHSRNRSCGDEKEQDQEFLLRCRRRKDMDGGRGSQG